MAIQASLSTTGFVDKRVRQGQQTTPLTNGALYLDRVKLKAALQDNTNNPGPGDATTYTNAYCAHMTTNDMVMAVRRLYDNAGV